MKGGVLVSGEDDSYFSPCCSFILLFIFTCFDKKDFATSYWQSTFCKPLIC